MRKILSIFTALLFAGAVCAQTDFAAPGYNCAADDAVLTGGSSSNFYLDVNAEPHHIAWSDVSLSSNALATWTVEASRGCYVSVSLDLGPVIASNKHNFEVKILDANQNIRGTLSEGGENTASEQVKTLEGTILLPVAGVYTVELRNNRDWGKGAIKNVILTYSADAPSEIVAVSSVELNKTEVTLEAEEVELLVATVSPENATDPTVTWATSDPEVATVSENGFVTAVAAGTANITASAGEQSATCAVTVIAPVVPNVNFAEPYVLSGKKAHLEGAIWKNEDYKLYGDGGHNKNYGTASWNIHVTKACQVKGALNGVEGGHEFVLDLYNGETLVASLTQPEGKTWAAGEIALDGTLAFAEAGDYTLKLRNTQEWSSGKVAGVTLTAVLENGFYLAGTMNGWGAAEGYKFVGNPANPAEFMLETTLAENDEFKVINYLNGDITAWYPNEGGNYVVDAAHAGDVTIYFQPDYKADWAEFGGYFYVAVPEVPQPEMTTIYDWAGEVGTTIPGASGVEISTVKIHNNADQIPAIKFGSSYVYAEGKWLAIKPAEGGFKAGDVVSVAAVFSNDATDGSKYAQVDIYAADGATRLMRGEPVVNGKKTADDPVIETLVLEADQDSLFFGRYGNTGMFITLLKVERAAGDVPVVLEAPDAAPAAPTYAAYQVHAVYSATYNADCNFGEWGSGTQYTQEEFGKKYVTTGMGYFGLEFGGMDCSEMEALHLDVWTAADASIRVVPIHGGTEVGVTVQLQGQQWNAIDIALSEFEGVTNWSNVYQIKIDNASNLTFWLNNVYFYTTQEKTVDLVDGYYLIGNINGWDIHNLTADHLFAVNPDNEAEYILHYTLAEGNEFKVVAVANNELGAWYPGEAGNYVVDFAHVGEKDIYFRPDYQGGEGWHAGCIYVEGDANANPWETWFATGDTWDTETESYLEWDGENQKATIHINVDKYGQWRAQAKYHCPVAEEGKCYRVALKMKANHAISNVTVKYQDNVEMIYVSDIALEANVEYVFDQTAAGIAGGNGIMILDFGFAHAGDIIEIYDVVIEEAECPQVEHTYTVAGGSAELFGTTWDPANTANDMVKLEDGTYKWEKTEVTLPAGNVEFKVVEDHAWTHCYPAENYQLVIPEAGVYTITITYNPEGNVVAGDAVKTGDAVVDPVVSIAGSMNSWNASADVMVLAEDKATASLTLNLEAQTYEFKVVINGGDWRSNAHEFTRENATAADMSGNLDNMHLVADVAGDYIFTWTFATNTLVITFPIGEGIDNTAVETKAIKRIVNGQLFIEMNGVLYNAQGTIVR